MDRVKSAARSAALVVAPRCSSSSDEPKQDGNEREFRSAGVRFAVVAFLDEDDDGCGEDL